MKREARSDGRERKRSLHPKYPQKSRSHLDESKNVRVLIGGTAYICKIRNTHSVLRTLFLRIVLPRIAPHDCHCSLVFLWAPRQDSVWADDDRTNAWLSTRWIRRAAWRLSKTVCVLFLADIWLKWCNAIPKLKAGISTSYVGIHYL